MSRQGAVDPDVDGQDYSLRTTRHGEDVPRAAAPDVGRGNLDRLAAHRAQGFAGSFHRPPEGAGDDRLACFRNG